MPSRGGIAACWKLIEGAGFVNPNREGAAAASAAALWGLVLSDVGDDELVTLAVCWLRSTTQHHGWPQPGALLQARADDGSADQGWAQMLQLLQWPGADRAPKDPESMHTWLIALEARATEHEQHGDPDMAHRIHRKLQQLPPPHRPTLVALYRAWDAVGGFRHMRTAARSELSHDRHSFRGAYQGAVAQRSIEATRGALVATAMGQRQLIEVD